MTQSSLCQLWKVHYTSLTKVFHVKILRCWMIVMLGKNSCNKQILAMQLRQKTSIWGPPPYHTLFQYIIQYIQYTPHITYITRKSNTKNKESYQYSVIIKSFPSRLSKFPNQTIQKPRMKKWKNEMQNHSITL